MKFVIKKSRTAIYAGGPRIGYSMLETNSSEIQDFDELARKVMHLIVSKGKRTEGDYEKER